MLFNIIGDGVQVSVEGVMQIFAANVGKVKGLLLGAVPRIADQDWTAILDANEVCSRSQWVMTMATEVWQWPLK